MDSKAKPRILGTLHQSMYPGHEHEANGEFAGESGNLHWGWWKTENRRFSLILQAIEKSMRKTGK